MSERLLPEQCCQNSVDRKAGQSTFSDKAKSTLLSINEALIGQTVTWEKRPYSNGSPTYQEFKMVEDYIRELNFIYGGVNDLQIFLREVRARN